MKSSKFNKNNNLHQHQNLDVIILDKKPNISQQSNKKLLTRKQKLAKMHDKIIKSSYPRLEMILLVCCTGLAGFLSSYWLYKFGFTTMWTRYLVSIGVSYMCFISSLKFWLWCKTPKSSTSNSSGLDGIGDMLDIPLPSGNTPAHIPSVDFHGGGGSFDGGSVDFDADSGSFGEAIGAVAHAEEAAIPLIVIVTVLFALLSSVIFLFSLVNSAPMLFSELLVDGVLSASLYRRLKGIDKHHWLESAIKRTFWPFFWVAITFMIVGLVVQGFLPQVHSIGELITMIHNHT